MSVSTYTVEGIDHLIVLVPDLDRAQRVWQALGFSLTPRGYHQTGGTANHLAMLDRTYIELLGLARPDAESAYREKIHTAPGLAGVALRGSADACFERWRSAGLEPAAPTTLARPVEIDGRVAQARFRLTMLPPSDGLPSPLFCCQHLTPELVWKPHGGGLSEARAEGTAHLNGAFRLDELIVVVDGGATQAGLERVTGWSGVTAGPGSASLAFDDSRISLLSEEGFARRFGAGFDLRSAARPLLAGIRLHTTALDSARQQAQQAGWRTHDSGLHRFVARDPELGLVIEWTL